MADSGSTFQKLLQNRPVGGDGQMIHYYRMDPPLCSGGPPHHTGFSLPTIRERHFSMPEIGEKERDYLFKELYKLKSNDLLSSLRSQSSLYYPHMPSPSPFAYSGVPYLRKRNRSPWLFSAKAVWSQKHTPGLPHLGLNPSTNLPLQPHFQFLRQSATPASILYFSSFSGLP